MVRNFLFMLAIVIGIAFVLPLDTVMADDGQRIYDNANLLTEEQARDLETIAAEYSEKHEIDFILLTTNDTEGKDVEEYAADFHDENALYGNHFKVDSVLLTIDMDSRDLFLASFEKAEKHFDATRIDLILDKIYSDISDGNYYDAFHELILTSDDYMRYRPGVNPESILLKWWFQLLVALIIAGVIVGGMAYSSGGKVTVNNRTYIDQENTKINRKRDVYRNKSVSRRKKPSNNSGGGKGGGGGITRGGSSYTGGRRSF